LAGAVRGALHGLFVVPAWARRDRLVACVERNGRLSVFQSWIS